MTHNLFDVYEDVIKPLSTFLINDVYPHSNEDDDDEEDIDAEGMVEDVLKPKESTSSSLND